MHNNLKKYLSMNQLENKKWLYQQYITNDRSCEDIAIELGTYRQKVRRALIKVDIKLKDQSSAQVAALKSHRSKHPTLGTKRPEDIKLRISEKVSQNWSEITPEELERRSKISRQQWDAMSITEQQNLVKAGIAAILRASREGSKIEKSLWEGLTKAGYMIEYHKEGILSGGGKLQIDMFIPSLSTAIEVDGPSHFLPIWGDDKLQKTIQSDQKKTGLLLSMGIVILRIKHIGKHVSNKNKRDILGAVLLQLERIKSDYPIKTNRLIEIEV